VVLQKKQELRLGVTRTEQEVKDNQPINKLTQQQIKKICYFFFLQETKMEAAT